MTIGYKFGENTGEVGGRRRGRGELPYKNDALIVIPV